MGVVYISIFYLSTESKYVKPRIISAPSVWAVDGLNRATGRVSQSLGADSAGRRRRKSVPRLSYRCQIEHRDVRHSLVERRSSDLRYRLLQPVRARRAGHAFERPVVGRGRSTPRARRPPRRRRPVRHRRSVTENRYRDSRVSGVLLVAPEPFGQGILLSHHPSS